MPARSTDWEPRPFALVAGYFTGAKAWDAIAHFGAFINMFNLIPVWQLDGGRGFASQTRQQRLVILAAAAILWFVTKEAMLLLIAFGATYRIVHEGRSTGTGQRRHDAVSWFAGGIISGCNARAASCAVKWGRFPTCPLQDASLRVTPKDFSHRRRNLPDRRINAHRIEDERHRILRPLRGLF